MLSQFNNRLSSVAGLFAIIGGISLVGLMLVVVIAVFWRYALNNPIFGIEDVSTMLLSVVVASSVAYGACHNAHVAVNIIKMVATRRITRFADVIARFLSVLLTGLSSYALVSKGSCGFDCGNMTSNLSVVHTPFYYFLAVAMAFFCLVMVVQLITGLVHFSGDDPNELID